MQRRRSRRRSSKRRRERNKRKRRQACGRLRLRAIAKEAERSTFNFCHVQLFVTIKRVVHKCK
jgi:hypothetical protein